MEASSSFWDASKLSRASSSEGLFSDLDKMLFTLLKTALEERDFSEPAWVCQ